MYMYTINQNVSINQDVFNKTWLYAISQLTVWFLTSLFAVHLDHAGVDAFGDK